MAFKQVRQATAGFVEAHERTLERILSEAASPGSKGWQPGEQELEAAALVLQLLARLVPYHQKHPSSAAIDLRLKAYQCASFRSSMLENGCPHQGNWSLLCLLLSTFQRDFCEGLWNNPKTANQACRFWKVPFRNIEMRIAILTACLVCAIGWRCVSSHWMSSVRARS